MTAAPPDTTKKVTGDLKDFNIFDITQSLMMSRKTAQVTVQSGNKTGCIVFEDGQIISARDDNLQTGENAAFRIFYWRGGQFTIDFGATPKTRNIQLDTENLMLEIARNMDENTRDEIVGASDANADVAVEDQLDDQFHVELNRIFDDVARTTTPTRQRYTVTAFDDIIAALNDLEGTALFLRPGSRPRVKTPDGFHTIDQDVVEPDEIEGFLNSLLNSGDRDRFTQGKEVTTYYSTKHVGVHRVTAFHDFGRPACIFTPASRSITPLSSIGDEAPATTALLDHKTGLVLVTGPIAGGASRYLASLLDDGLRNRDMLATLFAGTHVHAFSEDSGFIIRADLSRFALGPNGALQNAVEQGSDVIAVDHVRSAASMADAVTVASSAALVVAVLPSIDAADGVQRVREYLGRNDGERLWQRFASSLLGIVEVDLNGREHDGRHHFRHVVVTDSLRNALMTGGPAAMDSKPTPA